MAVYKATYCYPFLNTIDPRVVPTQVEERPAQYLKCKVDTSNKRITGYQIVIRDNENNIVFPVDKSQNNWKISPIQELEQDLDINGYINSGLNGTYLNIAFLQNLRAWKYQSYNSVYYAGSYKADYIISEEDDRDDPASYIDNWVLNNNRLIWGAGTSAAPKTINGEPFHYGDIVFVKIDGVTAPKGGLWQVVSPTELKRYNDYNGTAITQSILTTSVIPEYYGGPGIVITHGNNVHGYYYYSTLTNAYLFTDGSIASSPDPNLCLWLAGDLEVFGSSTTILEPYTTKFNIDGGSYKWEIILYQGEGTIYQSTTEGDVRLSEDIPLVPYCLYYVKYDNMSYNEYDMALTSGQILGSTVTRLQLANRPTAKLIGTDGSAVGNLPGEGMPEPLVLLNKYAQLCDASGVPSFSNRVAVRSFDSSYGHVYLKEGAITKNVLDQASKVVFYRHSNVLEDILEGDLVDIATTDTVTLQNYNITIKSFGGGNTIDGVNITQGMKVLIKNCEDPRYNGVYIAETGKIRAGSEETDVPWSRAGSFNNWGSFIGKTLCVRQGAQNRGKNFQSQAKVGGTLLIPDGTAHVDGSYLYFNEEEPIVLFDNLPNVNIYQADIYAGTTSFLDIVADGIYDGYPLAVGYYVLAYGYTGDDVRIRRIKSLNPLTWSSDEIFVSSGDFVKISLGQRNGNKVLENSHGTLTRSPGLSMAYILKNQQSYTFISPFTGVDKGNVLYFYNHDQVTYNTPLETRSSWMKINAINEKFWLIKHDTLKYVLDSTEPYKYELRSYFRSSDENPFFTYEEPYLKLALNDSFQMGSDVNPDIEDYSVATTGRYVTLQGLYLQPQKASWESYRWTLLTEKGEVVQDTGKRYDKELKTTFYGLNNEPGQNIYYAILDVEDILNKSLSLTVKITVNTAASLLQVPFNAEFNCETQSVILDCQDTLQEGNSYSFYRREYQEVKRFSHMEMDANHNAHPVYDEKTIIGKWEPVALQMNRGVFRDFNVKNNMSYQYIMYPAMDFEGEVQQRFANGLEDTGEPVLTHWKDWSLTELIPVTTTIDAPVVGQTYQADINNVWLFKYDLEVGAQTQNITKNEIQTLGQYSRVSHAPYNAISGDVTCMLGSEIIPYEEGYIERMYQSIPTPLSVNEKVLMLKKWRALVASKNPKLLKDAKGQSWIVQIFSSSNTPRNAVRNQPDSISFSWKEIAPTENAVIYGDATNITRSGANWKPKSEV